MARTGRPNKPAERRQGHRDHGNAPVQAIVDSTAPVAFVVPAPPLTPSGQELLPEVLLRWDSYWLSPIAQALDGVGGVDRVLVDDWIRLENELAVIERVVQAQRVVSGSKGQPRANPLMSERHALRRHLDGLRVQLGIGPRNRAQLGIDIAGVKSAELRLNEALDRAAHGEPISQLEEWSRAELYEEAQRLEIPGRSKMSRIQLIEALEAVS